MSDFQVLQSRFSQWQLAIALGTLILDRSQVVEDNCCFCVEISIQHWYAHVGQ